MSFIEKIYKFGLFNFVCFFILFPLFWYHRFSYYSIFCFCGSYDNDFIGLYKYNLIKLIFLFLFFIAFIMFDFFKHRKTFNYIEFIQEYILSKLPFLFFVISTLALHNYYFMYFLISSIFILFLSENWLFLFKIYFLFFLVNMFLSHYAFACSCRAKESSLKVNMFTVQNILNIYSIDWKGKYPENFEEMQKEASVNNYWKDFKNPFTGKNGYGLSYYDYGKFSSKNNFKVGRFFLPYYDFFGIRFYLKEKTISNYIYQQRGLVLYYRVDESKYFLYGTVKNGELLKDKGRLYYLTNN